MSQVLSSDYQVYLETLEGKLLADRFDVRKQASVAGQQVDLLGFKETIGFSPATGRNNQIFCPVKFIQSPDADSVERFSKDALEFASGYGPYNPLLSKMVFPVMVSWRAKDAATSFVQRYHPVHDQKFEHPVLVELESRRVFQNGSPMIWGVQYKDLLREIVARYFVFE